MLSHILLRKLINLQWTSVFFAFILEHQLKGYCSRCAISPNRAQAWSTPTILTYQLFDQAVSIKARSIISHISTALINQPSETCVVFCYHLAGRIIIIWNSHVLKALPLKPVYTKEEMSNPLTQWYCTLTWTGWTLVFVLPTPSTVVTAAPYKEQMGSKQAFAE